MKVLIFFALQFLFLANLHAEAPNLLTYQGRLKEGGQAVSGNRMVEILLCTADTGDNCQSSGAQSVTVSNGLFRSTFTVPAAALVGTGDWYLEIKVGINTLTPRERLTSSVYSLFAATAAYASNIAAAEGSDGVHITSNVYIVGYSSATKYYGDGSELTNLPVSGGAVSKLGDTMTGALTINAASALTTGNQPELVISTNIYVVGYSSAAMYYGNGSLLTGISATTVADGSVTDPKIVTVSSSKLTGTVSPVLIDLSTVTTALAGKLANEIKNELLQVFSKAEQMIQGKENSILDFDSTLPGKRAELGHLHPSTIVQYEVEEAFKQMGFNVYDGPQVESEYYNFTALNTPDDHPARDSQDTFWLEGGFLLRSQTSNLQVRMLEKYGAPFRGIFPGRVFRNEATDASHEHTFYQLEGLMVDKDINIGNLIATMRALLSAVFNKEVEVRLRPGFLPDAFMQAWQTSCEVTLGGVLNRVIWRNYRRWQALLGRLF